MAPICPAVRDRYAGDAIYGNLELGSAIGLHPTPILFGPARPRNIGRVNGRLGRAWGVVSEHELCVTKITIMKWTATTQYAEKVARECAGAVMTKVRLRDQEQHATDRVTLPSDKPSYPRPDPQDTWPTFG